MKKKILRRVEAMVISSSELLKKQLDQLKRFSDERCEKHGCCMEIWSMPKPHLVCPQCQVEQTEAHAKRLIERATKKVQKSRTTDVLKNLSIMTDDSLKSATFDSFETTNDEQKQALHLAKQLAYRYMTTDEKFNTLFTGLPGRGKSHLAISMLKAINDNTQKPMSCLFVSVDEFFRKIKDSFNYNESPYSEANMVHLLTSVDLLVLDDLGSEATMRRDGTEATDFTQKTLFGILNARKRTIITTNLNSKMLKKTYNEKLISRMEDGVRGHIIKFTDKTSDHRMVEF
jgi:DNA replication protein DnaC